MENTNPEFEVSRSTLSKSIDNTALTTAQINANLLSENNKILKSTLGSQLPPDVQFINFINDQKATVKKRLIPFVIGLITPYAPQIVPLVVSNLGIDGNSTADSIKSSVTGKADVAKSAAQGALSSAKDTAQDPKAAALFALSKIPKEQLSSLINCPSSAKIQSTIKQRNQLVTQINGMYKSISTLSNVLQLTTKVNQSLEIALTAIALIPYPVPINVIFAAIKTQNFINANSGKASGLVISTAQYGVFLGTILKFLNILDVILQFCANDQNMDFEQINNEINALANPTVEATQSEDNTYKGFTLGVKIDETNESQYIKRYAVAQTKQGVPVLRTESSFASDPAVLISQLKFIIDSNPNITAE